jgi:osmotically inducible protein OsmC
VGVIEMAVSQARATWQGDLASGSGKVSADSGAFSDLALNWKARTERPSPDTSPEELIAAAHAGCYSMAFSHTLAEAGHTAEHVDVTASVHFTPKDGGGMEISRIELEVTGEVPGLDHDEFNRLAREAEQGCPVSNALRGGVEISLKL